MAMFGNTKRFVFIALFTLGLIVLVNLAWWFYYDRTETMLENQLSLRLLSLARTAALALSPETVEEMALGNLEAYDKIAVMLEEIRYADSLAEVFILDENYCYLFTTVLEPDSVYFLKDLNGIYVDSLFFGLTAQALTTPAYRTGRLYLKSAFAPLFDPEGYLLAVLGVEANVDYFDDLKSLKNNLYYSSGLSILAGLFLGVVFLILQARLNQTEQKLFLGESHAFLGRMVAVVAHELKNPLMIIRASAERLSGKNPTAETAYIIEEVDRLDGIVTGYLDFARAGGKLLPTDQLETFDLGELLMGIKKHISDKYRDSHVEWTETEPSPALHLIGYRRSLRQVILNLLINGAEACLEAGRPVKLSLTAERTHDRVVIRIIDFGRGISRKEMKKLFSPFYTTKPSGSGLGLYLSRKIILEMGGKLEILSELERKTEVIIYLPDKPGK